MKYVRKNKILVLRITYFIHYTCENVFKIFEKFRENMKKSSGNGRNFLEKKVWRISN